MRLLFSFFMMAMLLTGCDINAPKSNEEHTLYDDLQGEDFASLWDEDATYVNLTTQESIEGKEEIVAYLQEHFKDTEASNIKVITESIDLHEPGKKVEKGVALITYPSSQQEIAFLAQYEKNDKQWLLKRLTVLELQEPPSHFEELKSLSWLVGDWVDEDENVDIILNYSWDKNKNFLIQKFKMSRLGRDELEGRQTIGWDPIRKQIRSWIFDSDGGFGESAWQENEGRWVASLSFVRADGDRASATMIYQKVDDNTYLFSSDGRDVGGEILPNIGPVKVVRKK